MRTINGIRVYKNIICIVLIAGLIMSITACGNKAKENKEFVTEGSVSDERISTGGDTADNSFMNLSTVFNKDESFHLNNVKGWIINVVLIKDELFFYTNETVTSDISGTSGDAAEEKNVVRFYKADADGGEAQLLAEIESGNKTYVDRMLVDGNSNIFVTKTKWISDERNIHQIITFDISFWHNGVEIEPENGKVNVSISLASDMKETLQEESAEMQVFHIDDDRNIEEIACSSNGEDVIFTADEFSEYALLQ